MHIAKSIAFSTIAAICGCSSFSATINPPAIINDAGTDGGDATGGKGNTGGTSATGGGTATDGSAVGGVTSTGGNSTAGGISSTGGSSSAGGVSTTGGASACSKDADCVNPDPLNCSYTCVSPGPSGVCKPAALLTPTKCATAACDDKAISGFWDAQGKPHIAFGYTETDGTASIRMQQLKLDGSLDGAGVAYKLPPLQTEPRMLSAAAQASRVALLWFGTQGVGAGAPSDVDEFALTDAAGSGSTVSTLDSGQGGIGTMMIGLRVTSTGLWVGLVIKTRGSAISWDATTGSNLAAWSGLLPGVYEGEFAGEVVGDTLMLTGADCPAISGCQQSFQLQRFSAASLTAVGSFIALSPNLQRNALPAMGPVNGQMAILWTETQSPGQLFRTLVKEDGTFAHNVDTVQSAMSPRAIVESLTGGSLLIGVITSGTPTYQLVAQRLDSTLGLIGNPLPIAAAQSADVSNIELHPSADGSQALITYRQAGARYRILGTNFCGTP